MKACKFIQGTLRRNVAVGCALLFPTVAWSQSSITLYGTADAGIIYTNKSFDPATGKDGGRQFEFINAGALPTKFGLIGQEDLGGGMEALFKLESGVSVANGGFDNDNGNLFGRQAYVGLSSNLGEVRLGLQFSPFLEALFDSDPRGMSQFSSAMSVYVDNTATGTSVPNAISYTSPKIAGLTAKFMYALGGVAGNFPAGRQYSASLTYEGAGLFANASIFDAGESSDTALNQMPFETPFEGRTIGLGYSFSSVNVKASFTNYKSPMMVSNGIPSGGDNNVWNIGFQYYPIPTLRIDPAIWYIRDPHDSKNHALIAAGGATYFLSKRTSLYAQIGVGNNSGRDVFGLSIDGATQGANGTTVGGVIGITHRF